jgi:hypothetical protein
MDLPPATEIRRMRRHPTEAEGHVSLNMSQASRFIAEKCGGKSLCPRVLQRHCHAGRLDYFRIAESRAFYTTEAWILNYLDRGQAPIKGSVPQQDAKQRADKAIARRAARNARKGGNSR